MPGSRKGIIPLASNAHVVSHRRVVLAALISASWLLSVVVLALAPATAAPTPEAEDDFVARIAGERAAVGLPAFALSADLVAVARRHSEDMARGDRLYHNPRLATEVQNWDAVGENVGTGETVESIHLAFMESATHRSEILSTRFTEVGVGVVVRDGVVWVTQVFRRPSSTRSVPAPGPVAAAPPPTTTIPRASRSPLPTTAAPEAAPAPTTLPVPVAAPPPTTAIELLGPLESLETDGVDATRPERSVEGASVRSQTHARPAPLREVTTPVGAAAALLVAVVGALVSQVAVESRRTAGVR